jgi:hypothetical protein
MLLRKFNSEIQKLLSYFYFSLEFYVQKLKY